MNGYSNPKSVKPTEPAVWIQEVGWVEAKPAQDLKVGEKIVYNCAICYTIANVTVGKNVVLNVLSPGGAPFQVKKRLGTLVPFEKSQEAITEEVRQNLISQATK